jgi:hypothetical protein
LHATRIFALILLAAVAVGCAPTRGMHHAAVGRSVLDKARVLAIARSAVAANDTWVARAEFETPERLPDGSWTVYVWRIPKTPGGHRLIRIDQKGRVKDYGRGL